MKVMAKKSVNKSALVRDYLAKYPEKGPSAIAKQITDEHGVKLSGKFVATIKTKLKQSAGSAVVASAPKQSTPKTTASAPGRAASKPAKRKPTPASVKSAPAKLALAPASTAGLSQHIANLKAAAHRLGKDEAKRIIDLF
jgi:hypothetical protein